jgi:thiol-disulfide isomerase/thioredoxin
MTVTSWAEAEIVFLVAPHCPFCYSLRPIIVRSEQAGDNSVTRRCVCRKCSKRFIIAVEPPEGFSESVPNFGRDSF